MIIGVDAACLSTENMKLQAGVYYVVLNLLKGLARVDKKNSYILYSFSPIPKSIMDDYPKSWKNTVLPSFAWLYLSFPFALKRDKVNLLLALNQAMPHFVFIPTIGFIHALDFDEEYHPSSYSKLKKNSEYLIDHASQIVTTSSFLKKELENRYDKKNVTVCPLGISTDFLRGKKQIHFNRPYFLFVGTFKPSKNIPTLLKAFLMFNKQSKRKYELFMIGSDFWLDENLRKLIQNVKMKKHIHIIPPISNNELSQYYKGAVAFVSPSLYEGFGMTFLEAMISGCPIVSSNVGGVAETVGNAGILCNPLDVEALANGMKKVSENRVFREKLIKKGKQKVKQYTWEKHAKLFYNVISTYE